jgi:hypothetical protein
MKSLQAAKNVTLNRIRYYSPMTMSETRAAWCCDLTEDASGYVATVEIPGEPDLMLIAPGGREPTIAGDGVLFARELMSPEQAYFNVAILPGWQIGWPTYRWGTLTSLNRTQNTGTVALADTVSSAQRLSVNESSTLVDIQFEYMDCHARAFREGDRVVVQFPGQSWATPKVIGFLDNPRACKWNVNFVGFSTDRLCGVFFYTTSQTDWDKMRDLSKTVKVRFDNGSWVTLPNEDVIPYFQYSPGVFVEGYTYNDYFYPLPDTSHPPLSGSPEDYGTHSNCSISLSGPGVPSWAENVAPYLPPETKGAVQIFFGGTYEFQNVYGDSRPIAEFLVTLNNETIFNAAISSTGEAIDSDVRNNYADPTSYTKVRGPGGYAVGGGDPNYIWMEDYVLFSD